MVLLIALAIAVGAKGAPGYAVVDPKVEYLREPLGVDIRQPRFSWTVVSTRATDFHRGATAPQAFRLRVSKQAPSLPVVWDSGRVESPVGAAGTLVRYNGSALLSDQDYKWYTVPQNSTCGWRGGFLAACCIPVSYLPSTARSSLVVYPSMSFLVGATQAPSIPPGPCLENPADLTYHRHRHRHHHHRAHTHSLTPQLAPHTHSVGRPPIFPRLHWESRELLPVPGSVAPAGAGAHNIRRVCEARHRCSRARDPHLSPDCEV